MIYRLLINYFRIKLLNMILSRVMGSKGVKNKKLKTMSLLAYGLELLTVFYANAKRKTKHNV